jgi:hypothetical protein
MQVSPRQDTALKTSLSTCTHLSGLSAERGLTATHRTRALPCSLYAHTYIDAATLRTLQPCGVRVRRACTSGASGFASRQRAAKGGCPAPRGRA